MAGIYLHIPFCKQKCHYCDFHFSTQLNRFDEMVEAICQEAIARKEYSKEKIKTIYFGGGTPSLLSQRQLEKILKTIEDHYELEEQVEITLECNPDDLSLEVLKNLHQAGVNRLSIGIQSFDDEVLRFMNRAHNSSQAHECLKLARQIGFENITMDLIYGIPEKKMAYWKEQVEQFLSYDIPHLSAYCLTVEQNTFFGHQLRSGKLTESPEDDTLEQFNYLRKRLAEEGFEQYEISNFAKTGFVSGHNSAYWLGEVYLGLGPSAHSYNRTSRSWNVANNSEYLRRLSSGELVAESEDIHSKEAFNEYILTRLRTKWGIHSGDLKQIDAKGYQLILPAIDRFLKDGILREEKGTFFLSEEHLFTVDRVSADLFY